MIFGLFILAVALSISAVAAYYSIAGLTAIFAAAVVPIVIMGAALEVGKIAATVWLHKFWHRASIQFKLYLVPAILILMLVTSMGIFGFLSKAHMDQTVTVGDGAARVEILDERIRTEQDNITAAKTALQQMDNQVNARLDRSDDDRGAERAVQIRRNQAKERKALQADIAKSQKTIADLRVERAPLAAETRKMEAEVGPIKYIAALIYGDNPDANTLERAVRWVIILLVFVFDPLALILILAAEQTIEWSRDDKRKAKKDNEAVKQGWHQEWVPDTEAWPKYEADDEPLTNEQLEEIKNLNAAYQSLTPKTKLFDTEEEFFAHGKEVARELDAQEDRLPNDYASTQSYLKGPVSWFKSTGTDGWVPKPAVEEAHDDGIIARKSHPETVNDIDIPILEGEEMWAQEAIDNNFALTEADADNIDNIPTRLGHSGFGTAFPANPGRGDMFLRVDSMPNRLYKWNGTKWIEISKDSTDTYAYDKEYINYLIEKIRSGEYSVDDLSQAEVDRIMNKLNYTEKTTLWK
jgi:hypothetical protein